MDYIYAKTGTHAISTTELQKCLIYHPTTLSGSSPVIIWNNPTFFDSWVFAGLIKLQASYGAIVVANHNVKTGTGDIAISSLDMILNENRNPSSKFYNTINENKIGVFGHSQGGMGTANAVYKDNRFTCSVVLNPSYVTTPKNKLNGPMLIIAGERDTIASPQIAEKRVYDMQSGSAILAIRSRGGHFTPVSVLGGDKAYDHYVTAWFLHYLQDKQDVYKNIIDIKEDTSFSKVLTKGMR